jgi:cytochrome bd-type quinol oxidase subunit 2
MQEKYPLLLDRIQSSFIDMFFIILAMFAFASVLDHFDNVPDWVRIGLFAGVFVVYEPFCMVFGCTLGNYLKGIRVRNNDDTTKRITLFQSLLRYPLKIALGWLSFLTIHGNPKKRAVHDLASGSVMIKL